MLVNPCPLIDINHINLTAIKLKILSFQTDQGDKQERNIAVGTILEQEPKSMVDFVIIT